MSFEPIEHSSGQQHWLKSYGLKSRSVTMLTFFWMAIFILCASLNMGSFLDAKISDPINFAVRDFLGRTPTQDERLKIYAVDDETFAMIGSPMPSLEVWGDILDSITARRPKMILIDAMFSENEATVSKRARDLFAQVKDTGISIVTGGFPDVPLSFKVPFPMDGVRYQPASYLAWLGSSPIDPKMIDANIPPWEKNPNAQFYGPGKATAFAFDDVGHFWLKEENKVAPFLRIGENVVPHMSMFVAGSIEFRNRKLIIDGKSLALDRHGYTPVNFLPRKAMKIKSMMNLIRDAKEGYVAANVKEGDVVLILPAYFTGNADMRPSPYGLIPGGLYIASTINSVLTGQWLQPVLATDALIIAMSVIAAALAYLTPASLFWVFWSIVVLGLFAMCQALFAYSGIVMPYLLPIISGSVVITHVFFLKVRSYERKAMALRMALNGSVSPAQMDVMSKNPDQVNLEPRERVLSLMFIDVVGFSLSSENMLPRMAFENLKNILAEISAIIYAHGGVIDKTLGDGLLCYFGYRVESDSTDADHPEKAVRCAAEIQAKVLDECLEAMKTGAPLYPVRIGVNTASCYLGDIGSGNRIEFTVVGNGVNFAKRLESACDIFSVMIGPTTFDMVKGLDLVSRNTSKKHIKIKHHTELIDAYEVQPLAHRQDDCEKAINGFRVASSLQRVHERMPVNDSESLLVSTHFGPAEVVNFSGSGISLLFNESLSIGTSVIISLESRRSGLAEDLNAAGFHEIKAEVRWNYQSTRGVVHGMMFTGFSTDQQTEFMKLVVHYAFSKARDTREEVDDDGAVKAG